MVVPLIVALIIFAGVDARADIYRYETDDGVVCFTNAPADKKARVVIKEPQTSPARRSPAASKKQATTSPGKGNFQTIAEEKARQHNVDPKLVKAVIKAESNWNAYAVSPRGARGLMQLMPSTAYDMGVGNPFDPHENIDGGVRYLKYLLEKFNGNLTLALAAYNAGPGAVERHNAIPSIPETVAYVKRVINHYTGGWSQSMGALDTGKTEKSPTTIVRPVTIIKKVTLEDGTILFTNAYPAGSFAAK